MEHLQNYLKNFESKWYNEWNVKDIIIWIQYKLNLPHKLEGVDFQLIEENMSKKKYEWKILIQYFKTRFN